MSWCRDHGIGPHWFTPCWDPRERGDVGIGNSARRTAPMWRSGRGSMRIAYVAHWDVSSETGILKKMAAQIRTWIAEGCTVRYFVVSPGDTVWAGVRDLPIHVTRGKTFWHRVLRMRDLYDAVVSWEPDIVYLRFSTYYPVLEAIVDRYPTVVEINSDDVREYRLMLSSTKYLLHRLSRSRLLRRVRGMVCVTGEIVSRPYFARFDKPALVLGNSISLSDYYVLPAPCNRVPRLVFSGLGKSPWHGAWTRSCTWPLLAPTSRST